MDRISVSNYFNFYIYYKCVVFIYHQHANIEYLFNKLKDKMKHRNSTAMHFFDNNYPLWNENEMKVNDYPHPAIFCFTLVQKK